MDPISEDSSSEAVLAKVITKRNWEKMLADILIEKEKINKLVMNYFLTEGYAETAKQFVDETGTGNMSDWDTTTAKQRLLIKKDLMKGEVEEAIQKINDLNLEILETNHLLLFHLRLQIFIELIRQRDDEKALKFSQEKLAPLAEANPQFMDELEPTVALLMFADDLDGCPLKGLMSQAQRNRRANEVNAAILSWQHHEKEAKIEKLLKMLIWTQSELEKTTVFPRILDLSTATVKDPPLPSLLS